MMWSSFLQPELHNVTEINPAATVTAQELFTLVPCFTPHWAQPILWMEFPIHSAKKSPPKPAQSSLPWILQLVGDSAHKKKN